MPGEGGSIFGRAKQVTAAKPLLDPRMLPKHPELCYLLRAILPVSDETVRAGAKALQGLVGLLPHASFWGSQQLCIASVFVLSSEIPSVLVE